MKPIVGAILIGMGVVGIFVTDKGNRPAGLIEYVVPVVLFLVGFMLFNPTNKNRQSDAQQDSQD